MPSLHEPHADVINVASTAMHTLACTSAGTAGKRTPAGPPGVHPALIDPALIVVID